MKDENGAVNQMPSLLEHKRIVPCFRFPRRSSAKCSASSAVVPNVCNINRRGQTEGFAENEKNSN